MNETNGCSQQVIVTIHGICIRARARKINTMGSANERFKISRLKYQLT